MQANPSFKHLSDPQLTAEIARLARLERSSITSFVACLEEFDSRRLYLPQGFTSIYAYVKAQFHLTDGAAYRRIEAARAVRRYPVLLDFLRDARLSLATICLLAPRLSDSNLEELLSQATHKSKRDVEALLARLYPKPPVPALVRKLPEVRTEVAALATRTAPETTRPCDAPVLALAPPQVDHPPPPSRRPVIAPLSEAHYKLQVTISTAAREKLRQIQDLMRHRIPNGDPAAIVEHALDLLHAELLKRKAAEVEKPRQGRQALDAKGRCIPASVRRAVFRRDRGGCAFVGEAGKRCGSTSGVEFHHVRPFAVGGAATVENIEMRCRAHNGFEWERHLDKETAVLVSR